MNEEQKQCSKHVLIIFLAALAGSLLGTLIACHCCIKHAKRMYFYSKMAPMMRYFDDFRNYQMQGRFERVEPRKTPWFDKEFFEEKYIIIPKDVFDFNTKDVEKKLKTSHGWVEKRRFNK